MEFSSIATFVTNLIAGNAITSTAASAVEHDPILSLFWLGLIVLGARLFGSLAIRLNQPEVIGEIAFGITLTSLPFLEGLRHDPLIHAFSEMGVCLLLFKVGLETNIHDMRRVGIVAMAVAVIGVVTPFSLGAWVVGPWLFPQLGSTGHLFIGGILVATSVGVTARIFESRGVSQTKMAQIVLGAAMIDDVLGLMVLTVLESIKASGNLDVSGIAVQFGITTTLLALAVIIGHLSSPHLSRAFSKVSSNSWMKLALPLAACFTFAEGAKLIGLAPIVGSFIAGLVMTEVHFKDFDKDHKDHNIEELIEPLEKTFAPAFFVMTGMSVTLSALFSPTSLLAVAALTVAAIVGKVIAGLPAGRKIGLIVGTGMIPRGEVGLIMTAAATKNRALPPEIATIMVTVVILATILPLPFLDKLIVRWKQEESSSEVT